MKILVLLTMLLALLGCSAPPAAPAPEPAPAPTAVLTPTPERIIAAPRCTGSMEPAITCLDKVILHRVRAPADIAEGAIVSFPKALCIPDAAASRSTVHRIIETREGPAGPEYLTMGDVSDRPDCWVPFGAIDWVVVEVRRNVYPRHAELRDAVQAANAAYAAARAAVLDHTEEVCGHRNTGECPLHGEDYVKGEALFDAFDRARDEADCWGVKAMRSERPGHIPESC